MKEMILKVGTIFIPLGFMTALIDYPIYGTINFVIGFVCLLELIDLKINKKN